MWRSNKTLKLLTDLQASKLVGEIILIDNDPNLINVKIESFDKIKYFPQTENIYVNPAWNLGVEKAKHSMLCICNDDINFNVDAYLQYVIRHEDQMGVFGSNYRPFGIKKDDMLIELKTDLSKRAAIQGNGFGMLMFLKKENWIPIPENIKIWFGDNWIIGSHAVAYSMELIDNIDADTHVTAKSVNLRPVIKSDKNAWNKLSSPFKNF